MTIETNKELAERFDTVINTGRHIGELDELCRADLVNHSLAPSRPRGLEGTRQFLTTDGRKFQDFRWRERFVVAEGDLVVHLGITEGQWAGGPFRGFDVPAGTYHRDTAFMYRIADGQIVERWAVNDHLAMLLQLGAIPDRSHAPSRA
jgi:predicted ester cyclase